MEQIRHKTFFFCMIIAVFLPFPLFGQYDLIPGKGAEVATMVVDRGNRKFIIANELEAASEPQAFYAGSLNDPILPGKWCDTSEGDQVGFVSKDGEHTVFTVSKGPESTDIIYTSSLKKGMASAPTYISGDFNGSGLLDLAAVVPTKSGDSFRANILLDPCGKPQRASVLMRKHSAECSPVVLPCPYSDTRDCLVKNCQTRSGILIDFRTRKCSSRLWRKIGKGGKSKSCSRRRLLIRGEYNSTPLKYDRAFVLRSSDKKSLKWYNYRGDLIRQSTIPEDSYVIIGQFDSLLSSTSGKDTLLIADTPDSDGVIEIRLPDSDLVVGESYGVPVQEQIAEYTKQSFETAVKNSRKDKEEPQNSTDKTTPNPTTSGPNKPLVVVDSIEEVAAALATPTPTFTATPTSTFTPTPTSIPTATFTATPTYTFTPTPTSIPTAIPSSIPTIAPTIVIGGTTYLINEGRLYDWNGVAPGTETDQSTLVDQVGTLGFRSGDGTSQNPYDIEFCLQLQAIRNDVTANYRVASTLDCSSTTNWNSNSGFEPIVNFQGSLDGGSFTITGLNINRSAEDKVALFANSNGATISNIIFSSPVVSGNSYVAVLVGDAQSSTIQGVTLQSPQVSSASAYAGSLAGASTDTSVSQITASQINVNGVAGDRFGGLIGNFEIASGAHVLENITINGTLFGRDLVGGVVGDLINSGDGSLTVSNINANVNCSMEANSGGGLMGRSWVTSTGSISYSDIDVKGSFSVPDNSQAGGSWLGGAFGYFWSRDGGDQTVDGMRIDTTVTSIANFNVNGAIGCFTSQLEQGFGNTNSIRNLFAKCTIDLVGASEAHTRFGALTGTIKTFDNSSLRIEDTITELTLTSSSGISKSLNIVGGLIGEVRIASANPGNIYLTRILSRYSLNMPVGSSYTNSGDVIGRFFWTNTQPVIIDDVSYSFSQDPTWSEVGANSNLASFTGSFTERADTGNFTTPTGTDYSIDIETFR